VWKKLVIPALFVIIAVALSGCFSPWKGDTATITINLGAAPNARAADYPPTGENGILLQLEHRIILKGPTGTREHTLSEGELNAAFSVAAGLWEITVEARLDGELYATGSGSVRVIAGKDNPVTIKMSQYITYSIAPINEGEENELTTTSIMFTFSASVDDLGLSADDITMTGAAEKATGAVLEGTGTIRTLPITVNSAGMTTVQITKHGIDAEEKSVMVLKKGEAPPALTHITAVYSGTEIIYPTTDLDDLKNNLIVMAYYSGDEKGYKLDKDDYYLSGELEVGEDIIITVLYQDITVEFKVTVTAAGIPVTGVELDRNTLPLTVGEELQLTATVSPLNAGEREVTWSSNNTNVTVDSDGKVKVLTTAAVNSTAIITVTTIDGNKTATCEVTVYAAGTDGLTFSGNSVTGHNNELIANVIIPACNGGSLITTIANNAFHSFFDLESVTIPDTVTAIGDQAFASCYRIASITIPEGVTTIGEGAFSGAFAGGSGGSIPFSIIIPASVREIGKEAFLMSHLESVTFAPDSQLETIGISAFQQTNYSRITIPARVKTIGGSAFEYCYSLISVEFEPNTIATFGDRAFPDDSSAVGTDNRLRTVYTGANGGAGTYKLSAGVWAKHILGEVDISGKTVSDIQSEITTALVTGDVIVTGTLSDVTDSLNLTIPSGKTVTWEANYSSSSNISLSDLGDFVLASTGKLTSSIGGGVISVSSTGSIIVRGMITNTAISGHGIYCFSGAPTIMVDGGGIDVDGSAIQESGTNGMTVIIRSGTLTSGATTINLSGDNGKLAILGGTLTSPGNGIAVVRTGTATKIYVAGGTIVAGGILNDGEATGYYDTDADKLKFNTSGNRFFTEGINLFPYATAPSPPAPWWE